MFFPCLTVLRRPVLQNRAPWDGFSDFPLRNGSRLTPSSFGACLAPLLPRLHHQRRIQTQVTAVLGNIAQLKRDHVLPNLERIRLLRQGKVFRSLRLMMRNLHLRIAGDPLRQQFPPVHMKSKSVIIVDHPPFSRLPTRPDGCLGSLPLKANSWQPLAALDRYRDHVPESPTGRFVRNMDGFEGIRILLGAAVYAGLARTDNARREFNGGLEEMSRLRDKTHGSDRGEQWELIYGMETMKRQTETLFEAKEIALPK
jgi:hypothetical protein